MEILQKVFTDMLNHIDTHKESYSTGQWTNDNIVKTWIINYKQELEKIHVANKINFDLIETMHNNVFNEFHAFRKRQNPDRTVIMLDGKEMNEIIRLAKQATRKELE